MPRGFFLRSLGHASERVPGVRQVPVLKLLVAAELAMLAREHVTRLTPEERRRVLALVRRARRRRQQLSPEEQEELALLLAKLEPRAFAGQAVDKLSPWPLPGRLLYGRRGRPTRARRGWRA
jgi:hypothetical protein